METHIIFGHHNFEYLSLHYINIYLLIKLNTIVYSKWTETQFMMMMIPKYNLI